jgi:dipeptidyl-peptidase-4
MILRAQKGFLQLMDTFDSSEKMNALACNSNQIFRRSFTADYYQIETKELTKLFDFQIQEPTFFS